MSEESQEFDRDFMNSVRERRERHGDEELFFCRECEKLKDYCDCNKGVD